jgi:hypothetical protein
MFIDLTPAIKILPIAISIASVIYLISFIISKIQNIVESNNDLIIEKMKKNVYQEEISEVKEFNEELKERLNRIAFILSPFPNTMKPGKQAWDGIISRIEEMKKSSDTSCEQWNKIESLLGLHEWSEYDEIFKAIEKLKLQPTLSNKSSNNKLSKYYPIGKELIVNKNAIPFFDSDKLPLGAKVVVSSCHANMMRLSDGPSQCAKGAEDFMWVDDANDRSYLINVNDLNPHPSSRSI